MVVMEHNLDAGSPRDAMDEERREWIFYLVAYFGDED
jgi:hypothetical protein